MSSSAPPPPRPVRPIDPNDPRLRARIRARIREARAADWRPWVLLCGFTGALQGLAFVGSDGRGWKAVPALCLLGALGGLALWALFRKATPKPRARAPQTLFQQLIDLCLVLLIAPLVLVAIGIAVWGGTTFWFKLLE